MAGLCSLYGIGNHTAYGQDDRTRNALDFLSVLHTTEFGVSRFLFDNFDAHAHMKNKVGK